jgi:hypothetical protein
LKNNNHNYLETYIFFCRKESNSPEQTKIFTVQKTALHANESAKLFVSQPITAGDGWRKNAET